MQDTPTQKNYRPLAVLVSLVAVCVVLVAGIYGNEYAAAHTEAFISFATNTIIVVGGTRGVEKIVREVKTLL